MGTENILTSKLFVSKSDNSTLRPLWPEHSLEELPLRDASQIRSTSEVYGVYHSGANGTGYGFHTKDGKDFEISVDGWEEHFATPEYDARIVREIEQLMGQENLKIVLY